MAQLVPFPKPSDEQLSAIVDEIKNAEPLLKQGLLRENELTELQDRALSVYEQAVDHNSIQYRKYDRSRRETTVWREANRSGYVNQDDAQMLLDLKQQIIELLNTHGIAIESTELFLPPNSEFTGRTAIKNILSTASTAIDIKDDYVFNTNIQNKNVDILLIVEPYLQTSLSISLRILGPSDQPAATIRSDIKAFLKQYPKAEIKGYSRSTNGKRETHDRFIVIDHKDVYKLGGSIKDLGTAQSSIDKVNDEDIVQLYITQFDQWWSKLRTIICSPFTLVITFISICKLALFVA